MISFYRNKKGCQNGAQGFEPYEHKTVADLARVICAYTWSPIIFKNNHRLSDNFLFADLCVLDIDNDKPEKPKISLEQVKKELCDCKMLIGITRNHQLSKNGKPPEDRFRVILMFDERIENRRDYEASMGSLMHLFDFLDDTCKDAARQFYPCKQLIHVQPEGETIPIVKADPVRSHPSQIKFDQMRKTRRGLSKNVEAFLQNGRIFDGGRNNSVFHAAQNLLQLSVTYNDALQLITEAPFERAGFSEKELVHTVLGVYKRAGKLY